jgi:hypothetical protein
MQITLFFMGYGISTLDDGPRAEDDTYSTKLRPQMMHLQTFGIM